MSRFEGMDTDVVRSLAHRLRGEGDRLDVVAATIQHSLDEALAHWSGPDAHTFHGWWLSSYRPGITAAHHGLMELATALDRHVADQESASGVGVTAGTLQQLTASAADPQHHLPPGWRSLNAAELKKLGLTPSMFHTASGMDATLTTDGHGHYVLAFAGTKGGPLDADWQQNLSATSGFGLVGRSGQVEDSVDLAALVAGQVGTDHLTLTGHSLGGRDAAVAAVATGSRAVTFNAAGATDEDLLYAQTVAGDAGGLIDYVQAKLLPGGSGAGVDVSRITNYVTSDDPLTLAQEWVPRVSVSLPDALGRTVVVPDLSGRLDAPLKGHDLSSFDGKI